MSWTSKKSFYSACKSLSCPGDVHINWSSGGETVPPSRTFSEGGRGLRQNSPTRSPYISFFGHFTVINHPPILGPLTIVGWWERYALIIIISRLVLLDLAMSIIRTRLESLWNQHLKLSCLSVRHLILPMPSLDFLHQASLQYM